MITDNNIILDLPFDESKGSAIAQDYSKSRADATIVDATFVAGKNGNALQFEGGQQTCEVDPALVDLSGDFTIMAWVYVLSTEVGGPTKLIWVIPFSPVNDYAELPIPVTPGKWVHLSFVKRGISYKSYLNSTQMGSIVNAGSLQGISLNQDFYGENGDEQYGQAILDDFKTFSKALTTDEVKQQLTNTKDVSYLMDGVDFKDYGIYVSDSSGLFNRPKLKTPFTVDWEDYHGSSVDLSNKLYESREIALSCFMKSSGKTDFAYRINQFLRLFDADSTRRLLVDVHPSKPLAYEIYSADEINVSKLWQDQQMTGTFELKLVEPEPVKRVLKHVGLSSQTCTITLTSDRLVNVYWGDGEILKDISGDSQELTHTYADSNDYIVVITGCIDEITDFSTNAIVVWNKL
jgi:hypothetical protein